jgi:hypothetical protein
MRRTQCPLPIPQLELWLPSRDDINLIPSERPILWAATAVERVRPSDSAGAAPGVDGAPSRLPDGTIGGGVLLLPSTGEVETGENTLAAGPVARESEPLRNQRNYRITDADRIGIGSLKQRAFRRACRRAHESGSELACGIAAHGARTDDGIRVGLGEHQQPAHVDKPRLDAGAAGPHRAAVLSASAPVRVNHPVSNGAAP